MNISDHDGPPGPARGRRFTVTVSDAGRGRSFIPVPFDPDTEWGPKTRHPVGGTLNGSRVRGIVQQRNGVHGFLLGAAGLRGGELAAGHQAEVYIEPEGPQRQDLAEDVAAALEASHRAAAFFDSLAQFYRRGVELLEAGIKDYRNQ